jgi:FtsP/CotA-like multicopper oxidase with cupredoxin domain
MISRRKMIASSAAMAGGAMLLGDLGALAAEPAATGDTAAETAPMTPGEAGRDYTPVVMPNGATLPFKVVDGVKVFHLVAEEFEHEFAPGLKAKCWGYNGRTPGPLIEAVEGDRVRIYVTNRLPEATSVHWHGILLPNGMDGLSGLNQPAIGPGETFIYEFTLKQHGTHLYHSHFDEMVQTGLGMMGPIVIHPRKAAEPRPDRDFVIMLSEWRIEPGTSRPNPLEMTEFNVFTMNSKVFPGTESLVVKLGQRVKIRLINLSAMDHHPIHLHGHDFMITETDGGTIPPAARVLSNTVLVAVGQTRAVEFVANAPGDWAFHCHMSHHVMTQMGHNVPNMVGMVPGDLDEKVGKLLPAYMTMGEDGMGRMAKMRMKVPANSTPMRGGKGPFGNIDMGGMFTILKVRKELKNYDEPGWYDHPKGTVSRAATGEEMKRDGVEGGG